MTPMAGGTVWKDALSLDDADCALIADGVRDSDASRIVVTHGTRTITDRAVVQADVLSNTIVVSGASSPACVAENDDGLGMATAERRVAESGIYIAMNEQIFHAEQVRQDEATTDVGAVR